MPKRHGGTTVFDSVLKGFLGNLSQYAQEAVGGVIPRCESCQGYALPTTCLRCGGTACIDHAWVSKQLQMCCFRCFSELVAQDSEYDFEEEEELAPPPEPAPKAHNDFANFARDWQARQKERERQEAEAHAPGEHWAMLGIPRGASKDEIKRAFREQAKECHPDLAGRDPEKKRQLHARFVALNIAYEHAIAEEKS